MNVVQFKKKFEEYLKDGDSWDNEIFANMQQSRNRAWIMAFCSMAIAILSLVGLVLLLPLKSFAPYVVTVDRQSGYVEVTKGLYAGNLTQDEAITQSNLVRYVSARESYNPAILRENYELAALMSSDSAMKELQNLWDGSNPDNPSVVYGPKAGIDIKIKSVSLLNENTASIRFLRELHQNDQTNISHWNAVLDFQYAQKPAKMSDRFKNPLGFQVTRYRLNPDALEKLK
ncbi:MAG: type IV secretion system protein [Alphaproteobacteria bacterium]|nr:type IV secretion system protein [Alphaproteobacteria bacterium]